MHFADILLVYAMKEAAAKTTVVIIICTDYAQAPKAVRCAAILGESKVAVET